MGMPSRVTCRKFPEALQICGDFSGVRRKENDARRRPFSFIGWLLRSEHGSTVLTLETEAKRRHLIPAGVPANTHREGGSVSFSDRSIRLIVSGVLRPLLESESDAYCREGSGGIERGCWNSPLEVCHRHYFARC